MARLQQLHGWLKVSIRGRIGVMKMCLAIPGRIVSIEDGFAEVDYGGLRKNASLRLFQNAALGDYVLVHAGFVIQILDPDEGIELEKIIDEMMEMTDTNEI